MASAQQIFANRRNAKYSTCPRTKEDKAISSQNSTTHGLTGQTLVLAPDDDAYRAYSESMLGELAPGNIFELDLARRIVCDARRLNRGGAVDLNLLVNGRHEDSAFRADAKTFNLLSLCEQRLQRSFRTNLALLKAIQKERQTAPVKAKSAPALAVQPIEIPAPSPANGFVYANASAAPPLWPHDPDRQGPGPTPETRTQPGTRCVCLLRYN